MILGELLAQEIEAKSDLKVERRFYLAGSYICQQALVAGRIDAYVEYTGTALTAILKQPVDRDPESVLRTVRRLYASRYGITVAEPLGFENTFAMVIRGDDARQLHLTTLSQAATYTPKWRLGVGYEFEQRPDGLPGLRKAYGLSFASAPRTMDLGLLYRALINRQVDMIAANSTDGQIQALGSDRAPGRQALFSALPGRSAGARRCTEALAPDSKRPYRPCWKSHSGRHADHEPGR